MSYFDKIDLPTNASTEAKQDILIAKDFATQTTLSEILTKIISAPATEVTLTSILTSVSGLLKTKIQDSTGTYNLTVNSDGSINAKIIPTLPNSFTLQNASSTTGVGTVYTLTGEKTLDIEITGTSTSRTINFEKQMSNGGAWYPIIGFKTSDIALPMAISTISNGETWQFDVTNVYAFRANLTVTPVGGTVTVTGRAS